MIFNKFIHYLTYNLRVVYDLDKIPKICKKSFISAHTSLN